MEGGGVGTGAGELRDGKCASNCESQVAVDQFLADTSPTLEGSKIQKSAPYSTLQVSVRYNLSIYHVYTRYGRLLISV